jgi:hypothetical protein
METCTVGSVRRESVGVAMVDLNGHEAGNGGYSQGTPTAHRHLSYSERCPVRFVTYVSGSDPRNYGAGDGNRTHVQTLGSSLNTRLPFPLSPNQDGPSRCYLTSETVPEW